MANLSPRICLAKAITNNVAEVKAVCEYCESTNDDDGVAVALEMVPQSV